MPIYNSSHNIFNLLCTHRYLTDSWKSLRLHWENFTLPFQWARIVIHHGRKRSTRWSVNWTVTCLLNSKIIILDDHPIRRPRVPQWLMSQCGLTRASNRKLFCLMKNMLYCIKGKTSWVYQRHPVVALDMYFATSVMWCSNDTYFVWLWNRRVPSHQVQHNTFSVLDRHFLNKHKTRSTPVNKKV